MEAKDILKSTADQYQPKTELWYVSYVDMGGRQIEEPDDNEFCEDCRIIGRDSLHNLFAEKGHRRPEIIGIQLFNECSPEKDDFVTCDNCGHYIQVAVLHTSDQEADHWLRLSAKTFRKIAFLPMCAWVIKEIILSEDFKKKHPVCWEKLSARVIKLRPLTHNT